MFYKSSMVLCVLALCAAGPAASPAFGVGVGERCGTLKGVMCDAGLRCDPEPGHCGDTDVPGSCIVVAQNCGAEAGPVCDCENKTHANDCKRLQTMVPKKRNGAC